MDDDILPCGELPAQGLALRWPDCLECIAGNFDVRDRQVSPVEAATSGFFAERWNSQQVEFLRLDQGDQGRGGPGDDGVEVGVEITAQAPLAAWGSCLPGAKVTPILPRPGATSTRAIWRGWD